MRLFWVHYKIKMLELLRHPTYVIPTLAFPSLFFLFFAAPNAKDEFTANILLASFCAFAVLGVVYFQFGVQMANEKNTPWNQYLKTLPASQAVQIGATLACALSIALLSGACVAITCSQTTPVNLTTMQFLSLTGVLVLGSIPFNLLGVVLGQWLSPKAALPMANLVYLLLSYAGGLWIPPLALPTGVEKISQFLPTRHYGELVWAVVKNTPFPQMSIFYLLAYTFLFLLVIRFSKR